MFHSEVIMHIALETNFKKIRLITKNLYRRIYLIAKNTKQSVPLILHQIMQGTKTVSNSCNVGNSAFILSPIFATIFSQLPHCNIQKWISVTKPVNGAK